MKKIRKDRKKTQKEVATAIKLSERNYQSFEYGKVKPSFDTLIALANYFDISIDYLVGRTDNPDSHKQWLDIAKQRFYDAPDNAIKCLDKAVDKILKKE